MGTVSIFRGKTVRKVPPKPRGIPWKMIHLRGKRPYKHPRVLKRGLRGKVLLEVGQVWVMNHNQRLWRVAHIVLARDGTYPLQVTAIEYRGTEHWTVSEQNFRGCADIWDVHVADMRRLMDKLLHSTDTDPHSPFRRRGGRTSALKFFGLDSEGNRVD
jgi:hypothetical protein